MKPDDLRSCTEYALEAAVEILVNVAQLQQIEAALRAVERRPSRMEKKVARLEATIADAELAFMDARGINLDAFDRLSSADQLKLAAQLKTVRRKAVGRDGIRMVEGWRKKAAADTLDRMTEEFEKVGATAQLEDVTMAIRYVGTAADPMARNRAPDPCDVVQMLQRRLDRIPASPSRQPIDELHAIRGALVQRLKTNAQAIASGFGDPIRQRLLSTDIGGRTGLLGLLHGRRMGSKRRDGLIARSLGLANESVVRSVRRRARFA